MSYRAIQKLRQEREAALRDDEESSSEDEEEYDATNRASGFASMMNDGSSSSSSSGENEEEDTDEDDEEFLASNKDHSKAEVQWQEVLEKEAQVGAVGAEDLDALLEEFKVQDDDFPDQTDDETKYSWYDIITTKLEIRDLDFDFVMRTSLLGSTGEPATARSNRRGRQAFVFGPPKDGWPRPPRYIGGGIGMKTYDIDPRPLPWPYSDMKAGDERCPESVKWFTFEYSDSYERDCTDYERVKASGDANMLALFCAHHPFAVAALLQFSLVLFQTNQIQEGRSFLQRTLWVFECSFLNSFVKKTFGLMDYDQPENEPFFKTLFRMVRTSHVAGLPRSAMAFSKFLLSLDPLRDPMNILLILDYFVLLANTHEDNEWLVDFIESDKVGIFYHDHSNSNEFECGLDSLPSMCFSHALSLYRIHHNFPSPETEQKAKAAMKKALTRFPSIFEQLLLKNEVDMSGQSYQTALRYANDRSAAMLNLHSEADGDTMLQSRISQAFELILRIFVDANYKLWSSTRLHCFMRDILNELGREGDSEPLLPIHPAVMRYASCDPADYVDRFQTMPAEANPLDRGLVAHAINVDPNRPRFMQRIPNAGQGDALFGMDGNPQGLAFAGPPTENIDPDWPLVEVFWRSALPWAHVEGVEPPPR